MQKETTPTATDGEPSFRHCQWLHGEGRDRNFCRNRVGPGEVWCQHHWQRVYQPGTRRGKSPSLSWARPVR